MCPHLFGRILFGGFRADPAVGSDKFGSDKYPGARFLGFLHEVLAAPGNDVCADCGAKGPRMAALHIGALLCYECAQLHSELKPGAASATGATGPLLTGSIMPLEDDVRLSDAAGDYLMLQKLGNTAVNAALESLGTVEKPKPSSVRFRFWFWFWFWFCVV